jgi:hypothetical protein
VKVLVIASKAFKIRKKAKNNKRNNNICRKTQATEEKTTDQMLQIICEDHLPQFVPVGKLPL